jgi:hypothetical protein
MGRTLGLVVAGVMILMGAVWTFQGLGYLEGSAMTDERIWAVIGSILIVLGIGVGVTTIRRAGRH